MIEAMQCILYKIVLFIIHLKIHTDIHKSSSDSKLIFMKSFPYLIGLPPFIVLV